MQPITERLSESLLRQIYQSDQAMYPTGPSLARLQAWAAACPELSLALRWGPAAAAGPCGVVVALPLLRPSWDALLAGRLTEADLEAETAFPAGAHPAKVGLHVFHLERLGREPAHFAEAALQCVRAAAKQHWSVLGYSALTATPAGQRAFSRLGFEPTGYEEIFTAPSAEQSVVDMVRILPGSVPAAAGESGGRRVVIRMQMVVRPGNAPFTDEESTAACVPRSGTT